MKKIGILLADELRETLRKKDISYAYMFCVMLAEQGFEFKEYNITRGKYPSDLGECDGYLITGSRYGVYDELPWLPPLFDFVRRVDTAGIPLVGVCFGHQVVAHALGGEVVKSSRGWGLGVHEWAVCGQGEWMIPPADKLRFICVHQDQVKALPPRAVLLASSDFCPNAMYAIGHQFFCVQGHPEFSLEYTRALLECLRDKIPPAVVAEAQKTLALPLPTNQRICAQWIANFLHQQLVH